MQVPSDTQRIPRVNVLRDPFHSQKTISLRASRPPHVSRLLRAVGFPFSLLPLFLLPLPVFRILPAPLTALLRVTTATLCSYRGSMGSSPYGATGAVEPLVSPSTFAETF